MKTTTPFSKPLALLLLPFLLLTGCAAESAPKAQAAPASAVAGGEVGGAALVSADRSLIVTIDLTMTVDSVDDAIARIRSSVEHAGGFVADSRASGTPSEKQQTAHLELRVPADKTKSIRASLGELGEITSSNEKVEDVTEQRADIEARLLSARTQEKRILQLMADKTSTIHDLVETERELARIRENIERLEAQERVMKSKIQLATVRVQLSTRSVPAWKTPGTSIVRAGKAGVEAASAISVGVGMAAAAVAPTMIPIALVIALIVVAARRRRSSMVLPVS